MVIQIHYDSEGFASDALFVQTGPQPVKPNCVERLLEVDEVQVGRNTLPVPVQKGLAEGESLVDGGSPGAEAPLFFRKTALRVICDASGPEKKIQLSQTADQGNASVVAWVSSVAVLVEVYHN